MGDGDCVHVHVGRGIYLKMCSNGGKGERHPVICFACSDWSILSSLPEAKHGKGWQQTRARTNTHAHTHTECFVLQDDAHIYNMTAKLREPVCSARLFSAAWLRFMLSPRRPAHVWRKPNIRINTPRSLLSEHYRDKPSLPLVFYNLHTSNGRLQEWAAGKDGAVCKWASPLRSKDSLNNKAAPQGSVNEAACNFTWCVTKYVMKHCWLD